MEADGELQPTHECDLNYPPLDNVSVDVACAPPPPRMCYKRRLGRAYVVSESVDKHGRPRVDCMIPACWPCMVFTNVLVGGGSTVVLGYCVVQGTLHWSIVLVGVLLMALTLFCLGKTSCSDPGIFPRYRHPQKPNWAFNRRSKSYRPPGVVFCSETQALVQDIDHFCPWTGTTIARKNILYFYCFLGALCILLAYMVIVGMLSSLPPGAFEPTMRKKGRP
tara:strand:- start:668 stop:1330 length:663 start_codon:yes stop_codon:yes gene_type:complete